MKVIGCEVIDAGKKYAKVVVIFEHEGKIASYTILLNKLLFIGIVK